MLESDAEHDRFIAPKLRRIAEHEFDHALIWMFALCADDGWRWHALSPFRLVPSHHVWSGQTRGRKGLVERNRVSLEILPTEPVAQENQERQSGHGSSPEIPSGSESESGSGSTGSDSGRCLDTDSDADPERIAESSPGGEKLFHVQAYVSCDFPKKGGGDIASRM